MLDTLPPSVPTGSARAARTAGKKLEFAREYCSRCPVPIQLIFCHARSFGATRKLQRIKTHQKRYRESPMERGVRLSPDSAGYKACSANGRCRRRHVPRTTADNGQRVSLVT